MIRLTTVVQRQNNNFDLVRLIAALMVVFGHSFDLFKTNGYDDPIKIVFHESAGTLAVYIFFFLSGIFITASFLNRKDHISFIRMRLFRIWPGLIVCTLLTVFVVGALFTTIPSKLYFTNTDTWKFLFSNILLYNVTSHRLPGLFTSNLYGNAVNGSLWTLSFEVKCYCLVFLLGIIHLLKNRIFMLCFFIALVAISFWNLYFLSFLGGKISLFFIAGSLLYSFKEYLPIDFRINLLLILASIATYWSPLFSSIFYITLVYTILVLGESSTFRKIKLPGDYSYGIYIYGFVVQQSIANFYPELYTYQSLIWVVPIVVILSAASWHFVEHPSIEYGKRPQLLESKR